MSGQNWNIGDQVMHPRRLEWGCGVVQAGSLAPKFKIIFATAGLKTIDTSIVPLRAYVAGVDQVAKTGEERKNRMKSARTPKYPNLFNREWEFETVTAWKKFWLEGGMVHEWADKYPMLFLENDRLAAFEKDGRGKAGFYLPWLAAILVWERFHYGSQLAWARPHFAKRRLQIMGSKAKDFEALGEAYAWTDFPQIMIFLEDFSKCSAVMIAEDSKPLSVGRMAAVKALRKIGLEVDLIRVRNEQFTHILSGHTPA